MAFNRTVTTLTSGLSASTTRTLPVSAENLTSLSSVLAPVKKGATANASTNVVTFAGHNLSLGQAVYASADYTGAGALPGALGGAPHFVAPLDSDTFYLFSTYADSISGVGTPINITTNGGAFAIMPIAYFTPGFNVSETVSSDQVELLKWIACSITGTGASAQAYEFHMKSGSDIVTSGLAAGDGLIFPNPDVISLYDFWGITSDFTADAIYVHPTGNLDNAPTENVTVQVEAIWNNSSS